MSDKLLEGRRVLLIIGGGIAAYKCLELVRRLRERGASVRAILTEAAQHFVTPLSVSSLTGDKVYTDLFSLTDEAEMGHIELSRDADLLVVAPATADLMAKMAHGLANDLASTALLATDKKVLIAPAMNVRMWLHPATQRNFETLLADGAGFVGPNEGDMACGEFGPGRMAEPAEILAAIESHFSELSYPGGGPLKGKRILITSGPTHEPIDPVRYLANRSSGKQGYAIAQAVARLGAETVLVSGPTNLPNPPGVTVKRVETAREMLAACEAALPADIAICAAAVADWRVASDAEQKLKKQPGEQAPALMLVENPDILATLSQLKSNRPALVIGFAAETEKVIEHAVAKRARKSCDWIVANDVSPATGVMGGDLNTVHLISREGQEDWPLLPKQAVAERLARRIADHFSTLKAAE
ncbi:MAG: bifunctional phosphopantothenoylcysteine decarboxylase/phosphopantothenate--cysteine ligase CoaBC [Alphaproteobacteria bacterium]|nr:bifunctional phosphopantothenoylcysteine decarboxylase/phosphopantothenate--cysteine ligase CoaBC [Alphaproteobacteria bacterium]MDX5416503.1 bifunctional phosphopantothenoylcysteine decarboxylase/phosphopantothenate--cysteine ligase CoaBC [Alphaproteobacteria bacterium]MDX5493857.1 bifunctional phosphopantothenoylcysteine decarboxylase/phosphopantothenate--cysteine ligase CoaBC [Alphaproteobacteria bacterium]